MPNMSPKKAPMPSQDPNVRNKNFLEVATGYTEEVAIEEAQRCLNCKHRPCVNGCPVHIAIPDFIKEVAQGLRGHPFHQRAARRLRSCLSAGVTV